MSYFNLYLRVLLYFIENALKESECSSWVEILCPVLFGHLNLKNLKKPKNFFLKTQVFSSPAINQ